jgi:hypothetical protein
VLAGARKDRQAGVPQALRREAHDAELHQANPPEGRLGRQRRRAGCQQQLAQSGPEQFILDFAWDEDTVENAMSECLADAVDQILNPDDWIEETEDEE